MWSRCACVPEELARAPLPVIITAQNMDSIQVSTYERTPGTTVTVTCFVPVAYSLIGEGVLTCQSNGQWDKPIPRCELKGASHSPSPTTTTAQPTVPSDLSLLPYMIGAGLGGLLCLFLAVLLCCAAYHWRLKDPKHKNMHQTLRRSSSPATVNTSLRDYSRDYRYAMSDKLPRESWRSRPCPTVSSIESMDPFMSRDRRMNFIPRPAWFTMLPRQDEIISPYV